MNETGNKRSDTGGRHPDDNVDPAEIGKFEALAESWWDPDGASRPLHMLNPVRLDYIDRRAPLAGRRALDVGCGGGLLSEGMAARGATVTGIDLGEAPLAAARTHLEESGLEVEYRRISVEALADEAPGRYDVVTCMELLEHVPEPASVVEACARLARPGGDVFFSTINRSPRAYLLAILGAEYVLGLLPRGTHRYAKLIRPAELAHWARHAGLAPVEFTGLHYSPLSGRFRLAAGVEVNYLMHARRES